MNDPYLLLNLDETADDEQVRAAYHRQLRLHPPERSPERFALISEAYETLRTERDRIYYQLFGPCPPLRELDAWVREVDPRTPRLPIDAWLAQSRRAWLSAKLGETA